MTTPSDPHVRIIQHDPQPQQVSPEVVETAEKLVRTKTFLKNSFSKVGLPVLIGATAAYVATRSSRSSDDSDVSNDDVSNPDE